MDAILIVGIFGFGVASGCGLSVLFNHLVERKALSLRNAVAGARGNAKQAEYDDRMAAAVTEFALMQKDGKSLPEIAKELLPKYPDVALRLGKQLPKLMKHIGVEE